jgi:hypothetical protein
MRDVDLAVWVDELAGEAAALAARAERTRARLREAALERAARAELDPEAVATLERLGVIGRIDEVAARRELRELRRGLAAVEALQAWAERRIGLNSP